MSKKPGSRRSNATLKSDPNAWLGFVKFPLTDEQKAWMIAHYDDSEGVFVSSLTSLVDDGYKVTFSINAQTGRCTCTITGKASDCPNLGYSLSGTGPSYPAALWSVFFKVVHIADRGAWDAFTKFIDLQDDWG